MALMVFWGGWGAEWFFSSVEIGEVLKYVVSAPTSLESCPGMGPFAFLCLCVWVWGFLVPPLPFLCVLVLSIGIVTDVFIGKWYLLIRTHPIPPGNSGNSGILGIVVRNSFAVRQNHFHGLGNYWEVIFTHSYSLAPPWEFRELWNSGNSCAK